MTAGPAGGCRGECHAYGVGHRGAGILGTVADLADTVVRGGEKQGGGETLLEDHPDTVGHQQLREHMRAGGFARCRNGWKYRSGPFHFLRDTAPQPSMLASYQ
jgi:hypothetical protein